MTPCTFILSIFTPNRYLVQGEAIKHIMEAHTQEALDEAFRVMDKDGSGAIGLDELMHYLAFEFRAKVCVAGGGKGAQGPFLCLLLTFPGLPIELLKTLMFSDATLSTAVMPNGAHHKNQNRLYKTKPNDTRPTKEVFKASYSLLNLNGTPPSPYDNRWRSGGGWRRGTRRETRSPRPWRTSKRMTSATPTTTRTPRL